MENNMKTKVFIDGREGTTGLRITERLSLRDDIEILTISDELRKDPAEKARIMNGADLVFLCLPDAAAVESAGLVTNPETKIIDASTAHRIDPLWTYGFPELKPCQREKIAESKRVAVPGCHASGFISLAYPLVSAGAAAHDFPFCCHSVTGYSGGGKKMIAEYSGGPLPFGFDTPRQYGLSQAHKHLPEMQAVCALSDKPLFSPIIGNFYSGMVTTIQIHAKMLLKKYSALDILSVYEEHYKGQKMIKVRPFMGEGVLSGGTIDAKAMSGYDDMEIFVCGNDERIIVMSRFDNLGKGASGAAVQCMNIMTGAPEDAFLNVSSN